MPHIIVFLLQSFFSSLQRFIDNILNSCILQRKSLQKRKILRNIIKFNLIMLVAILSGYIILIYAFIVYQGGGVAIIGGHDGLITVYIGISTKKS